MYEGNLPAGPFPMAPQFPLLKCNFFNDFRHHFELDKKGYFRIPLFLSQTTLYETVWKELLW